MVFQEIQSLRTGLEGNVTLDPTCRPDGYLLTPMQIQSPCIDFEHFSIVYSLV